MCARTEDLLVAVSISRVIRIFMSTNPEQGSRVNKQPVLRWKVILYGCRCSESIEGALWFQAANGWSVIGEQGDIYGSS